MSFDKLLPQILELAALDKTELDAVALATAKLSFYDWLVVSCAGSTEPLANIMRDFIASEGGATTATVTGTTQKYPCLLYTSPSPRDMRRSRMPSSA